MTDVKGSRFFPLREDVLNLAGMVMTSHPAPVTAAIARYRRRLDAEPVTYFLDNAKQLRQATQCALYRYFGVKPGLAAQTHSTTMGLAQILGGIDVLPTEHILTSANEHDATIQTLDLRTRRDRTDYRRVRLFQDSRAATAAEILGNLRQGIDQTTRVLTLAWVYSSDGIKLPIPEISALVDEVNKARPSRPLLFVVDGVHGFGVENTDFVALNCDFFIAGCHKSIFGPRGTAVICGKDTAWAQVVATVAKLSSAKEGPASDHVPGGVHSYEHWWALTAAFELHVDTLGKGKVHKHVHGLADRMKKGLAQIGNAVDVRTPMTPDLSSGIVCFDVGGRSTDSVVDAFAARDIVVTASAHDATTNSTHVRLSFSVFNDPKDVDRALKAVEAMVKPSVRPGPIAHTAARRQSRKR